MMDSYELSKIAGAVFAALLTIFVPRTLIIEHQRMGHKEVKGGYALEAPPADAAAEAAAAAPAAEAKAGEAAVSAVSLLAAASPENGKAAFGKCAACHTVTKGGANTLGPNLWGIVGRKIGGLEGFAYSNALKQKAEEGAVWDFEKLAAWVKADDKLIPGNKMIFSGLADPAVQADVVVYLNSLSDTPAPLPK